MAQQQTPQAPHDDHGSTPAAWTTVIIITIAFILGTLAIILGNWPLFWGSAALVVVGGIVGWVMAKAGLGKQRH
jgi:peptidoglycan/LPS O-acetylase OafA/YrhL